MGCGKDGGCSTACSSKLNVYDWLGNMLPPDTPEHRNIYEIRFKTTRKGFYRNEKGLDVVTGDLVVVESDRGWDVGEITMGGELVLLQMKKKKVNAKHVGTMVRMASEADRQRLQALRDQEAECLFRTRQLVGELGLDMKMSDVEFQADGGKAIFYYTSESRVDFRELIRRLANEFKVRVEMKQIGSRQEAALVGGIGACGRELCCSSWLTDFKSVGTGAARYQNLSLNPTKITGLCGRLKCCLNYELEAYMDALTDIPKVREIQTELGKAYLQKTDIFRRQMWFSYGGDSNWTMLNADRVQELIQLNKKGIKPPSLLPEEEVAARESKKMTDFVDVVGQSDLHERMQRQARKSRGSKDKRKKRGPRRPAGTA
ncbi:MAG: Signal peptidase-like protein [Bacteroidetes bacterium]|jgi:cell fate regulator YaaT (PSP1 superfamily)|nr:Signal peptidase-like protein [Bacteroidota bacterium]